MPTSADVSLALAQPPVGVSPAAFFELGERVGIGSHEGGVTENVFGVLDRKALLARERERVREHCIVALSQRETARVCVCVCR